MANPNAPKKQEVSTTQEDSGPQIFVAGVLVCLVVAIFVFLGT